MFADNYKIAIIGGGIFGCMTALSLAKSGFNVTIFERQSSIMMGTSRNNQNRLHLGFHYPRAQDTAKQCINGFYRFINEFPESILHNFPNAYYIASTNSLTTPENYIQFCNDMNLNYHMLDLSQSMPTETNHLSLGLICDEVVYDSDILTGLILTRISAQKKIKLKCNADVISVTNNSNGFILSLREESCLQHFDSIINCSYSDINRITSELGFNATTYQYEYTIIPIVKSAILRRIGLTVMDGDFMTFLPHGKSSNSLLYHVDHSVIDASIGVKMPEHWREQTENPYTKIDKQKIFENMKAAAMFYFPALKDLELVDFLHGPRMVLANCETSDARPSLINDFGNGYLTVFAGKVDHCLAVADDINNILSKKLL